MPNELENELENTGIKVTAMTYPSIEYDTEPEEVNGILFTKDSPFGGEQCWVNGIQVDPATIKAIDEDDEDDTEDEIQDEIDEERE